MDNVSFQLNLTNRSISARVALVIDQLSPKTPEKESEKAYTSEKTYISDNESVDSQLEAEEKYPEENSCAECPDCRLGTPIHIKSDSIKNSSKTDSESSFTDSAIYSLTSKNDPLKHSLV